MKKIIYLWIVVALWSCSAQKKIAEPAQEEEFTEIRQLDTLVVSGEAPSREDPDTLGEVENTLPLYQESYERTIDILHTTLDLRFDWEKESVIGRAEILLKPYFYPVDSFVLDAVAFDIRSLREKETGQSPEYNYDGQFLTVYLENPLTAETTIEIEYVAHPGETGGSAAITSDKGLFFINPHGTENKPRQIWTQGETEHNSKWFPTVDKPNERMTTDIYLTVEDRYKTLSNGVLINSQSLPDGFRKDHWQMDQPHAPYLVMIAVGEYVRVEDEWNGMPLGYWVEPEYEEDAPYIFNNTPEMLTFFSELIGIPYPWQNFDQIVVRDYVSGAMENTTAVVFGEFVQKKKRDLIDDNNDRIVAHEMIHHWFGNLVTTESWSNLTMNEGFANYSEHLWKDHHYGKYEGQAQLFEEKYGYLYSAQMSGVHPLINFGYKDKEDMFDAHAYNKGGLVLHMLRHEVGDDAFFAGLKYYLERNAYSAVEAHDLRLAMEHVTGRDLNWFFNQWYFGAGHPELDIRYEYDADRKEIRINVEQRQDPETSAPIFRLPAVFEVFVSGDSVRRYEFQLDRRSEELVIPEVDKQPRAVNFNPDHVLLAPADQHFSMEEATFLVNHADHVAVIMENLQKANPILIDVRRLLDFPAKDIRLIGLDMVDPDSDPALLDKVKEMALNDEDSFVRATAISMTGPIGRPLDEVKLIAMIQSQTLAYREVNAALVALNQLNPQTAMEVVGTIKVEESPTLLSGVSQIFAESGDVAHLPFFEKNIDKVEGQAAIPFYAGYIRLLGGADFDTLEEKVRKLAESAVAADDLFFQYGVVKGLSDLLRSGEWESSQRSALKELAGEVVDSVENPNYRNFFRSMLSQSE